MSKEKSEPKQKKGTFCPALTNENYEYHLSGDCCEYCNCLLTGKACLGREIDDYDDQSSQFFSRARIKMIPKKAAKCPFYGLSKETMLTVLREKAETELKLKEAHILKFTKD